MFDKFSKNKYIITKVSTFEKSNPRVSNDIWKNLLEFVSQDLWENFVENISADYRFEIFDPRGTILFRYESDSSVVELPKKFFRVPKILDSSNNIGSNYKQGLLEKERIKAI